MLHKLFYIIKNIKVKSMLSNKLIRILGNHRQIKKNVIL